MDKDLDTRIFLGLNKERQDSENSGEKSLTFNFEGSASGLGGGVAEREVSDRGSSSGASARDKEPTQTSSVGAAAQKTTYTTSGTDDGSDRGVPTEAALRLGRQLVRLEGLMTRLLNPTMPKVRFVRV